MLFLRWLQNVLFTTFPLKSSKNAHLKHYFTNLVDFCSETAILLWIWLVSWKWYHFDSKKLKQQKTCSSGNHGQKVWTFSKRQSFLLWQFSILLKFWASVTQDNTFLHFLSQSHIKCVFKWRRNEFLACSPILPRVQGSRVIDKTQW